MPFRFVCSVCGRLLYEDPSPNLRFGGNNTHPKDYFEMLLEKIGTHCPNCGHRLVVPPVKIEIYPIKQKKGEQ